MKNKNIILVGLGLAVVAGGAYFYFKNKKKPSAKDLVDKLNSETSSTNQAPAPTPTQSVDSVLATAPIVNPNAPITNAQSAQNMENLAKFTQAQGLATQIVNLRSGKKPAIFSFGGNLQTYHNEMVQNAQIDTQISNIVAQMNTLGYKEVNGVATKL